MWWQQQESKEEDATASDDDNDAGMDGGGDGRMDRTIEGEVEYKANKMTMTMTSTLTAICLMSYSTTFPRYCIEHQTSSSSHDGKVEYNRQRSRRLRRGIITKLVPPPGDGSGCSDNNASSRGGDGGIFGNALKLLTDVLEGISNTDGSRRRLMKSYYKREITMRNF